MNINSSNMQKRKPGAPAKTEFKNKILSLIISSLLSFMVITIAAFDIALHIKLTNSGLSGYTRNRVIELLQWFYYFIPLIAVLLMAVAILWSKHIAEKISGPLYALEKQLIMIMEGKLSRIRLRSGDRDMIPLSNLINDLIVGINSGEITLRPMSQEEESDLDSGVYTSDKKRLVCLLLCLFTGIFGLHRFYAGQKKTGLIWLFTLGIFGLGVISDSVSIILGDFYDGRGRRLEYWLGQGR